MSYWVIPTHDLNVKNFIQIFFIKYHIIKSEGFVAISLHTAHCTLHAEYWLLYTTHYTLQTAHCSLLTVHCSLFTAYCTLHTKMCVLFVWLKLKAFPDYLCDLDSDLNSSVRIQCLCLVFLVKCAVNRSDQMRVCSNVAGVTYLVFPRQVSSDK